MAELNPAGSNYTVTFSESGLPTGTKWSVTLNLLTLSATGTTIIFKMANGTYAFNLTGIPGWHEGDFPYWGNITVNGNPITEPTLVFSQVTYTVTFDESGLTTGTNWSVTYAGTPRHSTGVGITFLEPNGTYPFVVTPIPGYFVAPSSGNQTVNGGPVTKPINFNAQLPEQFNLTFEETGLPLGKNWQVIVGNQTLVSPTAYINTTELNGTYSFMVGAVTGYTASPSRGNAVVNGTAVTYTIAFTQNGLPPGEYVLTFRETGLPNGTTWQVTVVTATVSSPTHNITFDETNGTYPYFVDNTSGYNATPYTGNATLVGASLIIFITFSVYVPKGNSTPPPPSPQMLLGLPIDEAYLVIVVVVVIVLAAIYIFAKDSRGEAPEERHRDERDPSPQVAVRADEAAVPPPVAAPAEPDWAPGSSPGPFVPTYPAPVTARVEASPDTTTPVHSVYSCPVCHSDLDQELRCGNCGSVWTAHEVASGRPASTLEPPVTPVTGTPAVAGPVEGATPATLSESPPDRGTIKTDVDHEWEQLMKELDHHPEVTPSSPPPTETEPSPPLPTKARGAGQNTPPVEKEEVGPAPSVPFLLALKTGRRSRKKKPGRTSAPKASGTPYIGLVAFKDEKEEKEETDEEEEKPT